LKSTFGDPIVALLFGVVVV